MEQGLELDNLLILKYVKNIFRKKILCPKKYVAVAHLVAGRGGPGGGSAWPGCVDDTCVTWDM